jgi:tetratricopeptide (TPR) repeat protein
MRPPPIRGIPVPSLGHMGPTESRLLIPQGGPLGLHAQRRFCYANPSAPPAARANGLQILFADCEAVIQAGPNPPHDPEALYARLYGAAKTGAMTVTDCATVRYYQARLSARLGKPDARLAACEMGLQIIGRAEIPMTCRLLNERGVIELQAGDYTKARKLYEKALRVAQRIGDAVNATLAAMNLAVLYEMTGDYYEGMVMADRAVGGFEQQGSLVQMMPACVNLASCQIHLGYFEPATTILENAIAISTSDLEGFALPYLVLNLADASMQLAARSKRSSPAKVEAGINYIGSILGEDTELDNPILQALCYTQGMLLVLQQNWKKTERVAERLLKAACTYDDSSLRAQSYLLRAQALLASRKHSEALQMSEDAMVLVQGDAHISPPHDLEHYLMRARVLIAVDHVEAANSIIGKAHALLEERSQAISHAGARAHFCSQVPIHAAIIKLHNAA